VRVSDIVGPAIGAHLLKVRETFARRAREEVGLGPRLTGRLMGRTQWGVLYYLSPDYRERKEQQRRTARERRRGSKPDGDQGTAGAGEGGHIAG
jgi:hypothetical protein